MDKFVHYSKVRPEDEMLHDGSLQRVQNVELGPLYVNVHLPGTLVQRPATDLAGVRRPARPRAARSCPPLTARLTPDERASAEAISAEEGITPQELLAIAFREYKATREAPVPLPVPARRWRWRRKKAA